MLGNQRNKRFVFFTSMLILFSLMLTFTLANTEALADVGNNVSRSSSRSSSASSRGGGGGSGGIIAILPIDLIIRHPWLLIPLTIFYFYYKKKIKGTHIRNKYEVETVYKDNNSRIIPKNNNLDKLKEVDPHFDEQKFIAKVNNMFIQLQDAWTKKEWRSIRPFETDNLFSMHERQLQRYIDSKTTNVVDNISVFNTEIINYSRDAVNDIIDVMIQARFNDYVIDDTTGRVIKGNPNEEFFMTYNWRMIRKIGVLTEPNENITRCDSCPQCGAPIAINATGVCDYCQSVVSKGDYNWVLSEIELIKQERRI